MSETSSDPGALDIAIVGMAGRFPGAPNLDAFWDNLRGGVESIASLDERQLDAFGVPRSVYAHPSFVNATPLIADADRFDAAFFGYSPGEAELIDPQQRVFLECAWEALESAGYAPDACPGTVGVFAGTGLSSYLLYHLLPRLAGPHADEAFQVMIGNDKDFVATRVSYKLNLHGPSVTVQTGCSTSLVAAHLACQALLAYQCDVALAGGVSIQVPARAGYLFQDGGLQSPDGHCRAFDARAQGTLFGSGAGIVVLKRLTDALNDRDTIRAVIKGTAINNDGARKVGYTAPSIRGQAEAIRTALAFAQVEARNIGYVECHGTATALGDPIEVAALAEAFGGVSPEETCRLGSVKTNIGHLDAAAGVAGLIKTTLALERELLPPSLHFESLNPRITLENTPFRVNTESTPWPRSTTPRRAGVSSFGIGGTNAHVVLEEAPSQPPAVGTRDWHLFTLSAKSDAALERQTEDLHAFFETHDDVALADAAYTTQAGRSSFEFRRAIVASDRADLLRTIETRDRRRLLTRAQKPFRRSVVFMFPGGGSQYVNMGAGLYASEPIFREAVDRCAETIRRQSGRDLLTDLFAADPDAAMSTAIRRSSVGLPTLFVIEYALAQLLIAWGIKPAALIGHSLGEYTAACLAGVFSLDDALSTIVTRSKLMEQVPPGAMLSVALASDELQPWLADGVSLAAANGPTQCVLSGPAERIAELMETLGRLGIECRRLSIEVASHSDLVTSILQPFAQHLEGVQLRPPKIPFVSNLSGTWITAEEAVDPGYWVAHLRRTVRFGEGVLQLLNLPQPLLLEVGPGHALSTACEAIVPSGSDVVVLGSMRHYYDRQPDEAVLAATVGKLWLADVAPDWMAIHRDAPRQRVPLPTYPFQRKRYWVPLPASALRTVTDAAQKRADLATWFYVPAWKNVPAAGSATPHEEPAKGACLILGEPRGIAAQLATTMASRVEHVVQVDRGDAFELAADGYRIDPNDRDHYRRLLCALHEDGCFPRRIVHAWNLTTSDDAASVDRESAARQRVGRLSFLVQALVDDGSAEPIDIWVLTSGAFRIESGDIAVPEQALVSGLCKVVSQEFPHIRCHIVDVPAGDEGRSLSSRAAEAIASEMLEGTIETVVAYRGGRRWTQTYEPCRLDGVRERFLREAGVYLLVGGLGSIGLRLAEHLARTVHAKLILTARSPFPPRDEWDARRRDGDDTDAAVRAIRRIVAMEQAGAEVVVMKADAGDEVQMAGVIETAERRFGALHGVVHLAGVTGVAALQLIPDLQPSTIDVQLRGKVDGAGVLKRLLAHRRLDFVCLFSSNAAVLGGPGLATYAAANAALDAFADHDAADGTRWVSIDWDAWPIDEDRSAARAAASSLDAFAMTLEEGFGAFDRVMSSRLNGQVVVSTGSLEARLRQWLGGAEEEAKTQDVVPPEADAHERPELEISYIAPRDAIEERIARVWQDLLRISHIGTDDNFFDLGGTSVIALKIVSRLKKDLGLSVPIVMLFEAPTVGALARAIAAPAAVDSYDASECRGSARREQRLASTSDVLKA